MYFIPIAIPGFVFGIGYLWYSANAAQKGGDNIDHMAHYFGALFGFVFPIVFKPSLLLEFFAKIIAWISRLI